LAWREALRGPAHAEAQGERSHRELREQIAEDVCFLGRLEAQREGLSSLSRKLRRSEAERIERAEGRTRERIADSEAALRGLASAQYGARAELAVAEHLIAERERRALVAIGLSPPPCILRELGERPADPHKRAAWDEAVRGIERYRQSTAWWTETGRLGASRRTRMRGARNSHSAGRSRTRSAGLGWSRLRRGR
jgi:hypothetical protein